MAMMQNTERLLYLTDRIFVNTSVTEQWQLRKRVQKAPFMIADEVAAKLAETSMFSMAESVKPGFLNLKLDETF